MWFVLLGSIPVIIRREEGYDHTLTAKGKSTAHVFESIGMESTQHKGVTLKFRFYAQP